ncbi:hypothetical protein MFIFM68171_02157 [Madurella fahalii]|uniref:Subtilisin-like serine protease n=1 Tax=Madurella fahalii TaxID=1157608 RepID=A0ABQ0G2F5_9PEZI
MYKPPTTPPFTPEAELFHCKTSTQPTTEVFIPDNDLATSLPCIFIDRSEEILLVSNHVRAFIMEDLSFSRLDVAYKYLWWAGRQFPARPLHRQVHELGRTVAVTYRADLHLVWCPQTRRIFLKPLPRYLLSHFCWASHVSIDRDLDAGARGFLLSYIWLIRNEHDWTLAHDARLLPAEVTWAAWRDFVESLIRSGGLSVNGLVNVHRRFHYGELRVNRLNHIYRLMCPFDWQRLFRGYGGLLAPSYSDFFRKRFRWIVIVFASCTTVLSALQVGLATDVLGSSKTLQDVSSGIVLFSLIVLGITVVVIFALYIGLFVFFLVKTLVNTAARKQKRRIWADRP